MRIKGAMTILNKRAEFYGMTVEELVQWLDKKVADKTTVGYVDETVKVLQAYEVYKMDQGYEWSGVNFICLKSFHWEGHWTVINKVHDFLNSHT